MVYDTTAVHYLLIAEECEELDYGSTQKDNVGAFKFKTTELSN